ncbi:MAG TPA: hypothetical protein DD670_10240, partial [Planctomycetaceae bacterium]|nr:hypothetical protein [Planctomycetaceae bacterium]
MFRRFLPIAACVAIFFASVSLVGADPLYWDILPGDGPTISDGAGTWSDGSTNWNNGVGDVNWNNNAPAIADFGSGTEVWGDLVVTVWDTVKASGIVSRKAYTFTNSLSDTIQLEGQTPSVRIADVTKFYVSIATGSGVESVNLAALGTSTTPNKYLYLYAENTFDAPLIIGSDPEVAAGVLVMPSVLGALGGSSTAGITVLPGSCLSIRADSFSCAKPITI